MLKRFKNTVAFLILIASVIYIAMYFYQNRDSIQIAIHLNIWTIISIVLLSIFYHLLHSYRFRLVLEKCSGRQIPFFPWFRIYILGRFFNTAFPQMGNIYRSVRLKQDYNISYTRYISGFASFAWLDMSLNLTIATVLIFILRPDIKIGAVTAWLFLLVAGVIVMAVPVLSEIIFRKTNIKQSYLSWVHAKLSEVLTITVANLRDLTFLAKIILLGMIVFIRTLLIYHILFLGLGVHIDLSALTIFYVLFKISTFINVTPGNLGVQEIAFGFLSEQIGVGMASGILLSIITRIFSTSVVILLGLLLGGVDLLRHREDYVKSQVEPYQN